jgi:hypothetical protein
MTLVAGPVETIRLSYSDGNVLVTSKDADRFVMTAQKAVEACQDANRHAQAVYYFKTEFLRPLHAWCLNQPQVLACYVQIPASPHLSVFVISRSERYDFDLAQKISNLELKLADSGWSLHILQIPLSAGEETWQTFFDTKESIQVYAQLETT